MAVLLEEVDGEKGEIRVAPGVVADVKVAHLFEDDVGGSRAHDHLTEGGRNVNPHRHVRDHALEEVALRVVSARGAAAGELPQLQLEVGYLALPGSERSRLSRARIRVWRGHAVAGP